MTTQPFYRTEQRRDQFILEARSWLGTPASENVAVKGPQGGVDCVHLVHAVHRACGAIGELYIPHQSVERVRYYGEHHAKSLILDWFGRSEKSGLVRRVEEGEEVQIGDVVVIQVNVGAHHIALWCGHMVIHLLVPGEVVYHSTQDPEIKKHIRCAYRVLEVAT